MLQTGMIKQSSAGIYSCYRSFKVMKKIEKLLGRNKIHWSTGNVNAHYTICRNLEESGRYDDYGENVNYRQGEKCMVLQMRN